MQAVLAHAQRGGYVMGICNGFQILTEAGLLDGALLRNTSTRFLCKNVYILPQTSQTLLTHNLGSRTYKIPIAHAEGNYYCDSNTLHALQEEDRILFRYCTENGVVSPAANPNGSLDNIAGITNKGRNVFGMMPHPERATDSVLGNLDGKYILDCILSA
jgi:phosphoribosylformylglycinamidine synthase